MKKILFLDFDGVLNHMGSPSRNGFLWIDATHVKLLNSLMEKVDGLEIVVSSAWRHGHSLEAIRGYLVEQGFRFPEKIIGITPSNGYFNYLRGDEIGQWINENIKDQEDFVFAIVDDMPPDAFLSIKSHLVHTEFETGLTLDHINQILEMFGVDSLEAEDGTIVAVDTPDSVKVPVELFNNILDYLREDIKRAEDTVMNSIMAAQDQEFRDGIDKANAILAALEKAAMEKK